MRNWRWHLGMNRFLAQAVVAWRRGGNREREGGEGFRRGRRGGAAPPFLQLQSLSLSLSLSLARLRDRGRWRETVAGGGVGLEMGRKFYAIFVVYLTKPISIMTRKCLRRRKKSCGHENGIW
jgi:hypothetical protein